VDAGGAWELGGCEGGDRDLRNPLLPACLVPAPVAVAPFMSTRRRRPPAPAVAEAETEASPSSWSMGRWSVGQPTVSLEAQGVSLLSPAGAGLPEGGCGAQKMNPFWLFIFALHVT